MRAKRNTSRFQDSVFGELIFAYTRAEALADGVLIDATRSAKEAGLRCPVALTASVWAEYVRVPEGLEGQDESGRLWDVVWMLRHGVIQQRKDATELTFQLYVKNANNRMPELVSLRAVCGPDDNGEPCVTVMRLDED
jgi:hypothetical protein